MSALQVVIVLGLIAGSLAAPTFPETTNTDDCPISESIKSFPHPTNCSKYYQCENGTKVEMNCTYNFHYNPKLKVCDFPKYAGCKVNESSTQLPLNDTETKNETRTLIGKEELKPKFDQKVYERNNTLGENGTGFVRNGNSSLETNFPENSRNENITFNKIFGDSKLRNSSFNNTAASNTTGSATNSSLLVKETLRVTTEKIIPFRNNSQSSHEPNGVNNSPRNATTPINKEETTEDSSGGITGLGKTTIQKVNVSNGKEIKIADKKEEEEDDSDDKDNKDDETEEEDKKENEKP